MKKKISIIATFRNEEECINEFISRINNSFKKSNRIDYKLIFVDDFSDDLSNALIKKACIKNKKIKLITLKKRYGHNASIQTGFDFVSKKNYAAVIDCDLQDQPELIAKNFSKIKAEQTIHFVRKKREDPFFQRFYAKIAYLVLHFISRGKIIKDSNYFKIITPNVVKKIKKNTEIDPYWHYLFTKHSAQNKIVYYVRKKRIYGSPKFNIFTLQGTLQGWLTFFTAIYYFKKRFVNIILTLLIINILILLLVFYNFYNVILILFLSLFICFLITNLFISSFIAYYKKKNKRIYCKYK